MNTKITQLTEVELRAGRFLIRLLRFEQSQGLESLDDIPADGVTWTSLINQAKTEGLEAFLGRVSIQSGWASLMPPEIRNYLLERYLLHKILTSECISEYLNLEKKFQQAGVDVIPIKGIALIQTLYRETGDRSFNDIDLLVRPDSIDLAARILVQSGYKPDPYRSRFSVKPAHFLHHHMPPFRKGRVTIELHYKLLPGGSERFTRSFFSSAESGSCGQVKLFPEKYHHAVFLAAHLDKHASHGQSQLRLIRDLACLLSNDQVSWNSCSELAASFDLGGEFQRAEAIYRDIYVSSEPACAFHHPDKPVVRSRFSMFNSLKALPGCHLKILAIADFLFPSTRYVRSHYPQWTGLWLPLWYVFRIYRGFRWLLTR